MADECSTCVFYQTGYCCQRAPMVVLGSEPNWPQVETDDWCGDGISSVDGHYFSTKNAVASNVAAGTPTPPTGGNSGDLYFALDLVGNTFIVWYNNAGVWTQLKEARAFS